MTLKVENNPRIGDQVANENLKHVEIVFDVFGPTASPYVAVNHTLITHKTASQSCSMCNQL